MLRARICAPILNNPKANGIVNVPEHLETSERVLTLMSWLYIHERFCTTLRSETASSIQSITEDLAENMVQNYSYEFAILHTVGLYCYGYE